MKKYILVSTFIFIYILILYIAKTMEKKNFNNDICPKCKNKLRQFDTNSQGDRGYVCDKCYYTTWCSYNVDKQYRF